LTTLFNLVPNNILTLQGRAYQLLGEPVLGGSSLVYKARLQNDISRDIYMIKEFFPRNMDIVRTPTGEVYFPENKSVEVNERKSRARNEVKIANELRYDHCNDNNNPWFLSYSEPVEANNTLYTIITTESGEMLSDRIDNGYFSDKGFETICDCILRILDALEPLHKKGYIHLDISPDNIHFSDTRIARLIDYNSAYHQNDPLERITYSYKTGYSALELTAYSGTKTPSISRATDLFSVAAIFFEIIKERRLDEDDWSMPNSWYLNNSDGYLKGASELLIAKTNAFIQKGISSIPRLRFQSANEMRVSIEELIQLKREIKLINDPKRPNTCFVGRNFELCQISILLEKESYVFIEGIGGFGKTELAKTYAWNAYNEKKYDIIQFVSYVNSIQETIALFLKFDNFDSKKYDEYIARFGKDAVKYIFHDKTNWLKAHSSYEQRILIIIDNFQGCVNESDFKSFVSGQYHVIFTSREKHEGAVIEVAPMRDDVLFPLFCEYYAPMKLSVQDEPLIHKIMDLLYGHTMTIMLVATTMRKSNISPVEMLKRLENNFIPKLRTKIKLIKESVEGFKCEQEIGKHIHALFDMTQIQSNDSYVCIMTNMALLSDTGMEKKLFYRLALSEHYHSDLHDDEDYTDINWLIERRWIQENYNDNTSHISLHAVISDVVNHTLKPDSSKCRVFLENLHKLTDSSFNGTYIDVAVVADMLKMACARVNDETLLTAALWKRLARASNYMANYALSLKYYKKAAMIFEKHLNIDDITTADVYGSIASIYHEQGEYQQAHEWFEKAIAIVQIHPENEITVTIYNNLAGLYSHQNKYESALAYYEKSLMLCKSILGKEHPDVAITLNNIGSVYLNRGDYTDAMDLFEKSLKIYEKAQELESLSAANTYGNMAQVLCRQKNYMQAYEMERKALAIREYLLGEEHPDTATSYNNIAFVFSKWDDNSKALEFYNKALKIIRKTKGEEHPRTITTYKNIFSLYLTS